MTDSTVYTPTFVYNDESFEYGLFDEGRLTEDRSNLKYEYILKDHLGNTRVTFTKLGANITILQQEHYYPFGMTFAGTGATVNGSENMYKYNGKELQDEHGLNWYDYGARMYDAQLGRWHCVDPLAEQYSNLSPYNYVANNPINAIDPDGMRIFPLEGTYTNPNISNETKTQIQGDQKEWSLTGISLLLGFTPLDAPADIGEAANEFRQGNIKEGFICLLGLIGLDAIKDGKKIVKTAEEAVDKTKKTTKKVNPKKKAREEGKKKRDAQPASEDYAKYKAKELEKKKGKDARREAHDKKEKGSGDRTKKQIDRDYNSKQY